MATILDDDEKNQQNEQVLSNSGGTIEGQGSGGQPSGAASQPGGGGFTNLQQYVTANQGNDAQMGQKVEENVGQNAQAADQAIGQYRSGAQDKIKQGTVTADQSISDALTTSPEKIVNDQGLKSQFDKQYNAQFTGDTQASAYQGYDDATGKAKKVQQEGLAAGGDNEARRGLLNDVYSRPDYGQGQQNLDSFILGAGKGGQQSLQNLNQKYATYNQNADQAVNDVQGQIQKGIDTSKQTKDATRSLVDQQTGKYDTQFKGLQDYVGKQQAQMQSQYQGAVAGLSSQDPNQRAGAFKQIGLDPKVGEWLVSEGYSPAQLVQAGKAQSLGDVAGSDDVSHYQALAKLQGLTPGYDFSKSGGGTQAFTTDQAKLSSANQASGLISSLQSKLKQQQQDRAAQYARAVSGPVSFDGSDAGAYAQQLGISPEDLAYARSHNIDPAQFVTKGRDISLGDVADDGSRSQFANLMNMLGLKGKEDLTSHGAVDSAYNFNKDTFGQQIAAAKAKEAAAAPRAASPGNSSSSAGPVNTGDPNTAQHVVNQAVQSTQSVGGKAAAAKKKYFG